MPNVHLLDDQSNNQNIWTDFVQHHPDAAVDHCWEWRWIIEKSFNFKSYYLGAFDKDRLTGILPLFLVPRGFGRSALVSIPFGNYGGICADTPEIATMLLEETKRLMLKLKCSCVELRHKIPVSSEELQSVNDRARYSMAITDSAESIFAGLKQTCRKKVRNSKKMGVTIQSSRDTDPLYKIHLNKFRRLGTPCFPRSYFDSILEYFGERSAIYYTYYQNKAIAFRFVLFFRQSLLSLVGGDLEEYLHLNPNYLLIWHEIETAAKLGLAEIDLCRSRRNSGPAQHKLFWGMTESSLGYQFLLPDKEKFVPRSTNDFKFKMASCVWRKIPLSLTQALGPKLVRYFA